MRSAARKGGGAGCGWPGGRLGRAGGGLALVASGGGLSGRRLGCRDFCTSAGRYRDIRAGAVLRGLTGDAAVMRIGVAGALGRNDGARFLEASEAQNAALLAAIEASLAREAGGDPQVLGGVHPGPGDAFFAARLSLWRFGF